MKYINCTLLQSISMLDKTNNYPYFSSAHTSNAYNVYFTITIRNYLELRTECGRIYVT